MAGVVLEGHMALQCKEIYCRSKLTWLQEELDNFIVYLKEKKQNSMFDLIE